MKILWNDLTVIFLRHFGHCLTVFIDSFRQGLQKMWPQMVETRFYAQRRNGKGVRSMRKRGSKGELVVRMSENE